MPSESLHDFLIRRRRENLDRLIEAGRYLSEVRRQEAERREAA